MRGLPASTDTCFRPFATCTAIEFDAITVDQARELNGEIFDS